MADNKLYATEALSVERERRGMTQQEMADMLSVLLKRNVSVWLYQKWEYRKRPVSTTDALAISRELGISVKELWVAA